MSALRVGFIGASGTGKSTLAAYLAETRGLPLNPVGSRSVSKDMGFESPYDVDKAGRRAEFQARLLREKAAWEAEHEDFVTDRTVCDNLAYTALHDVFAVDAAILDAVASAMARYTHVVYCPVASFCDVAGDPSRVADATYHKLYDAVIFGLLARYARCDVIVARDGDLRSRKYLVDDIVDGEFIPGLRQHAFRIER